MRPPSESSAAKHYLALRRCTTMVPATMSYTVLLCWKKSSVTKTGKRKAMEKFLLSARTVDLREREEQGGRVRNITAARSPDARSSSGTIAEQLLQLVLVHVHSRREGDIRGRNHQDPVGLHQSGRVTRHHPQAHQELPRRGASGSPDTYRLIRERKKEKNNCFYYA